MQKLFYNLFNDKHGQHEKTGEENGAKTKQNNCSIGC